jgi:hypothetical protein
VYCVFCSAKDLSALWAYQGLKLRRLSPLEVFTPEALVYNRRLEHRLWNGESYTRLTLQDGRVLDSRVVRGGLNRICALPQEHFLAADPADRDYAIQEQQAIFLSWLHSLPGVWMNRPGPRGLSGDERPPAEWAWLAGQAGMPGLPLRMGDTLSPPSAAGMQGAGIVYRGVVLDGQMYSHPQTAAVPDGLRLAVARLAHLSGLRLFGIDFASGPAGEWLYAGATTLPDLSLGGEALLDALAEALG